MSAEYQSVKMCRIECAICGVPFAYPQTREDNTIVNFERGDEDAAAVYCPNGHRLVPVSKKEQEILNPTRAEQSEITRLRRELTQEKHNVEQIEAKLSELKSKQEAATA